MRLRWPCEREYESRSTSQGVRVEEKQLFRNGNFGFGIQEHIDLGIKYDERSVYWYHGMNFYCVMGRPGFRAARKKRCGAKVGFSYRIGKEDTVAWFKKRFGGIVACPFNDILGVFMGKK
jgi:large subunit ribosomal protein L11e